MYLLWLEQDRLSLMKTFVLCMHFKILPVYKLAKILICIYCILVFGYLRILAVLGYSTSTIN